MAVDVGTNAAVLFYNICFWVAQNEANERNFVNGKYWTYNSVRAFCQLFPEFTQKQISTALKRLEENGYIESAYLNPDPLKREKWYTVCDKVKCFLPLSKMQETEKGTVNNIYNNKNTDTDNNQSDNNFTDNSHKGKNINKVNAKAYTSISKKQLPESAKKKTKSELKELEADMIKRFDKITSQYDVSDTAFNNITRAFRRYFDRYTQKTGKVHPILKDETLEKVFTALATITDTEYSHFENVADIDPDSSGVSYLEKMVDEHFRVEHKGKTDYHITHFANSKYLQKLANHVVDW